MGLALGITAVLAVVALVERQSAIDREQTARAQARAAQSIAALSRDPEQSLRDALEAVAIRSDQPEAVYALQKAVSAAGWTSILRLPHVRGAPQRDVEFSEDGSHVATAASNGVAVWDAGTGRPVTVIHIPGQPAVDSVQFNREGSRLLTASEDGIARTWDSSTGALVREFDTRSKDGSELTATWGAGGRRVLTAGSRGGAVWDAETGKQLRRLKSTSGDPRMIRMSLDGRRALTAGARGSALLWNLETNEKPISLAGNRGDALVYSLLSDDGRRVATFYSRGGYCLWDDGRAKPRRCVPRGKGRVPMSTSAAMAVACCAPTQTAASTCPTFLPVAPRSSTIAPR